MVTPFSQFVGSQALMNVLATKSGQERYSRIPDEVLKFVLGHFGTPEGPIAPEVLARVAALPRAAELSVPKVEKTLEQLHAEYGSRLGRELTEEELLLRIVLPEDQADIAMNASAAPTWNSHSARKGMSKTVINAASFIKAVNELPSWKRLSVTFNGENIQLSRPGA
jgi:oxaloacetate decarboxylase alpha subunit